MFRSMLCLFLAAGISQSFTLAASLPDNQTTTPRSTLSLNGEWHIEQGSMETPPEEFPATVPVPGLVDMARPPFEKVGVEIPERQAFWFQRTFNVTGPVPAVALLKISKAAYSSRVILNGTAFDEHWPSFTPAYTDVRKALHVGENQLLIRVGAGPDVLPAGVPQGFDEEKTRYIPGLFDNVELILSGSPSITNIQAVPDINKKTVRVQTLLKNGTGASTQTELRLTVREHLSGRVMGKGELTVALSDSDGETTATADVSIADCRLWSPEDPFLYDLEVSCPTDKANTRFGMRSFRLDQATGRAILNGKPYFLRGSNITLYRFFEDAVRGTLPWNEQWVRGLHKLVRSMHWNSLRYCIGFPPEFWYDIADEEGILIQDEFPIWNSRRATSTLDAGELAREYSAWMRERWNHPCVVIWDAENETSSTATGEAIAAVRSQDLSGRPWDNGYGAYREPGDNYESHPYLFNRKFKGRPFRLSDLAETTGTPVGNITLNSNDNPIIINEYGWLWLNRDGSPTTLTRAVYKRLLGENSTTDQRRNLHARLLAALTEFWRGNRECAGVLHFCILGYSRADGQTSDHFTDVEKLQLQPEFVKYVRDAFAPVGVMIDFWAAGVTPGQQEQIAVSVINDLETTWTGKVALDMLKDGRVKHEQEQQGTVPPLGKKVLQFPVTFPAEAGNYQLRASLAGSGGEPVSSWRDVVVTTETDSLEPSAGLAVGRSAKASSSVKFDGKMLAPRFAFDGEMETRWAAKATMPQWLEVDLEKQTTVSAIELIWEAAYGEDYHIDVSLNRSSWTTVYQKSGSDGDEPLIRFSPTQARYVRLIMTKAGTKWGPSLYEMKVF